MTYCEKLDNILIQFGMENIILKKLPVPDTDEESAPKNTVYSSIFTEFLVSEK